MTNDIGINPAGDPTTFELWKPKIEAQRKILKDSIPSKYLIPDSKLPSPNQLDISNFAYESGLLTTKELEITETSASNLVLLMSKGEISAVEVLKCFFKKAIIGNQLLNFATEFLGDSAFKDAEKLDEYFKKNGKVIGPLHGVPMSIKEHLGFGGRPSNGGYVSGIGYISPKDPLMVKMLKEQGAVFFVRTNQPQTIMHLDTNNNIIGMTKNPFNLNLSPGGSSGGEGAIFGFKASCIGIGTDIGGSIRCPAAFNGTYAFKPCARKLSGDGQVGVFEGHDSILGTEGPFTQHPEDIDLFMELALDHLWEHDVFVMPVPWKTVNPSDLKNITIGVMYNDGVVQPHPPVLRGLEYAVKKLSAAGANLNIKLVKWEPYKCSEAWDIISHLYFNDGVYTQGALKESGEPLLPLTEWSLRYGGKLTTIETYEYHAKRDSIRQEYNDLFKKREVDFVLSPAYCGVASKQGDAHYWGYTSLWNCLDHPGAIFPLKGLKSDPSIDKVDDSYVPMNPIDEREYSKYSKNGAEFYKGAPISLQLVGRKYKDEETVAAMRLIDGIINA